MPVDRLQNRFARSQGDLDVAIQNEPQLFQRVVVERIADDHLQRAVFLRHRQNGVFAGDRFGHQFDDRRRNRHLLEIDEIEPMLLGHGPHDFVAAGIAEPDQFVGHFLARFLGKPLGVGQLVGADDPFANQNFGIIAAWTGHIGRTAVDVVDESMTRRMSRSAEKAIP